MHAYGRDPGPSIITTAGKLKRQLPAWRRMGGPKRSSPPLRQQGCKFRGQSLERLRPLAGCIWLWLTHLSWWGVAWVMTP